MSAALTITLSLVNLITAIVHVVGCYLLVHQYRNGEQSSQQLYLINLAVSEGVTSLLQFLVNPVTEIISMSPNVSLRVQEYQHHIKTLRGYGFVCVYFLTMIFLTLDKLLDILLNIRYHLYWNENRTMNLLKVTWFISITTSIVVSILKKYVTVDFHIVLDKYVYPTFDIAFLIIAGLTYGFIFHKYKQTRESPTRRSGVGASAGPTVFQVFKRSRFYIPVLLMSTFIVFMVIPEMVHLCVIVIGKRGSGTLKTILTILWALSYLSDAIIYIWMKESVKLLLKRKLGGCTCGDMNVVNAEREARSVHVIARGVHVEAHTV